MKLLVVSQYFWPETFRINDIVADLVARGHEVTVLTGKPNYPDGVVFPEYERAPADFSHFAGADIVRVPMPARGKGGLRLALNYAGFALSGMALAPFRLKHRQFDAILVCLLSPVTSVLPAIVMRRLRHIPSVVWVLDLWPQSLEAVNAVRSRSVLAAVDRLVGYIYRRSDLILGQSRSFAPQILRHVDDPNRVGYLPSWSEHALATEPVAPAPEIPSRPDLFNIVFTGNIGEAQDFPAVLDAAELLRDEPVRWLIVGDGRKAEWTRAEVARRGLAEKFLLPGRFPAERMASFYSHADALLVSLRPEPIFAMTIPAKVQAYLAAGKPILAMLDGEGADVVRASGAGATAAAGDARGLAEAVRRLMRTSPEERLEMGGNGRAYGAREFDRDRLFTQLEGWLEALVQRNRAARGLPDR